MEVVDIIECGRRKGNRHNLSITYIMNSRGLFLQNLLLTPGVNLVRLNKKANQVGKFFLGQVAIHIGSLHLCSSPLIPRLTVEVKEEGPTLKLYKRAAPLLSGIEQIMNLIVTIGSYSIEPVSSFS